MQRNCLHLEFVSTLVLIAINFGASGAMAQQSQHRTGLLDLKLGTSARDLPEEAFIDYACGTNGGPPGRALGSFKDFSQCTAEADGLYEVAFRYDDELEYRMLARGDLNGAEINGGTTIGDYAIYASALFDDAGILRGLRAVTDEHSELRQRANAYMMADFAQNYFGREGFECVDHEPADGREPLAGKFVDQSCSKAAGRMLISTEAHLFRKAGQTEVDRLTGQVNRGQFDSSARLEIRESGTSVDGIEKLP